MASDFRRYIRDRIKAGDSGAEAERKAQSRYGISGYRARKTRQSIINNPRASQPVKRSRASQASSIARNTYYRVHPQYRPSSPYLGTIRNPIPDLEPYEARYVISAKFRVTYTVAGQSHSQIKNVQYRLPFVPTEEQVASRGEIVLDRAEATDSDSGQGSFLGTTEAADIEYELISYVIVDRRP